MITYKQLRRPNWDCGGWMPETSWSCHYWQPAPRWRPHWWLAKPDNPAMSPHALDKTGTRHTDTQWKAKGGEGREQKPLTAPHITRLLPAPLINKPYSPEHEEFHACASIQNPLTNWLQTLLVVYLVKLRLTSFNNIHKKFRNVKTEETQVYHAIRVKLRHQLPHPGHALDLKTKDLIGHL